MNIIATVVLFDEKVNVGRETYRTGAPCVSLTSERGEPFGTFSVNLPDEALADGEFFAKTWSENESMRRPLLACGAFEDTGRRIGLGFVEAEVWKFASSLPDTLQELN